jgi:hypothetical protein
LNNLILIRINMKCWVHESMSYIKSRFPQLLENKQDYLAMHEFNPDLVIKKVKVIF